MAGTREGPPGAEGDALLGTHKPKGAPVLPQQELNSASRA